MNWNNFSFLLSVVGLGVSGYLAYHSLVGYESLGCPIGGESCANVNQSPFSQLFGIPVSWLGVFTYFLLSLAYGWRSLEFRYKEMAVFLLTLSAFLFSVYLMTVSAFVIESFCSWCVTSAVIMTSLFTIEMKRRLTI